MESARLIVHGGLGAPDTPVVRQALEQALEAGWRELAQTGDPVAAACAAVRVLEDDGRFNAGSGGVPTDTGEVELDAGVFQGWTGRFAGVAALRDVANPVLVAAALLAHRPGAVLLAGDGARRFAEEAGLLRQPVSGGPGLPETETVGCIARASDGGLAAASSTGGVRGQALGRVGDTPVPGAGIWADERMAVLCSGQGEHALRRALAVRTALLAAREGAVAAAERAVGEAGPAPGAETGIVVYDAASDDVVARASRGTFPVLTRDRDGVRAAPTT